MVFLSMYVNFVKYLISIIYLIVFFVFVLFGGCLKVIVLYLFFFCVISFLNDYWYVFVMKFCLFFESDNFVVELVEY